jgi:hypothetical protein
MSTETHTLIIEADATKAHQVQQAFAVTLDENSTRAQRIADALEKVENETNKTAEATAKLVKLRQAEADELEHQARLMRTLGASQDDVDQALRQALRLRREAAVAAGDEAQIIQRLRAEELQASRELARAQKRQHDQRVAALKREGELAEQARIAAQAQATASPFAGDDSRGFGAVRIASEETQKWHRNLQQVGRGFLEIGGSIGNVVTGLQSAIAIGREAVQFVSETVDESFEVQAISRNMQIDISQARDALGGLVADKDLALAANKAFAMDVATTGEQFAEIAELVSVQAVKLGKDQTQLINDYVEAVGKQEAEIFDNLGLTLRLTDAYDIQAEALGKSASELTKAEKAAAFQKAALIELRRATQTGAVEVEGFARHWREATVAWKNFRGETLGFEDTAGRVAEALRQLSEEDLEWLRFAEALSDADAKQLNQAGRTAREMLGLLEQWNVGLDDLKKAADDQNITYLELLENGKAAHAELFEQQVAARLETERLQTIQELSTQADDLEHSAQLLEIMGGSRRDVLETEIAALETRRNALLTQAELTRSAQDEAKAKALTQQIELKQATIESLRSSGGRGRRRDPSAAINRERDAALAVLDARQKIFAALENERISVETQAAGQLHLIDLARQELDIREEAERLRDPRKAADQAKQQIELQKIATERRLLDIEVAQVIADADRQIAEQRLVDLDREIERNEALGVSVELLRRQRNSAALELATAHGSQNEMLQVMHEQELARIEEDRAARVQVETERLTAFEREVELAQARGEMIRGEQQQRLEFEEAIANAEGDAARRREILHKQEVARVQERVKRQQAALQATQGFLGQAQQFGSLVVDAAIKDDERREKAAMRLNGIMALVRAAIETVEAVAAFARYDFVGGALHVAAAAVATATGVSLLAGSVPRGGSAGAAGATASAPSSTVPEGSTGASSPRETPATPPNAEELTRIRGGLGDSGGTTQTGGGGGVVNISNSTIVTNDSGTVFDDLQSRQTRKRFGT